MRHQLTVAVIALAAVLVASSPAFLIGQAQLSDKQIAEAIAQGKKGVSGLRFGAAQCYTTGGFMNLSEESLGFSVSMRGALGRIAFAAYEAKKNLKPFAPSDVDATMLSDDITFYAEPTAPHLDTEGLAKGWHRAPLATNLVLRRKTDKKEDAIGIQPKHIDLIPSEWSNAMGGKFTGQGLNATFSTADLPSEFDVVVVTSVDRERSCSMKAAEVAKVKGSLQ